MALKDTIAIARIEAKPSRRDLIFDPWDEIYGLRTRKAKRRLDSYFDVVRMQNKAGVAMGLALGHGREINQALEGLMYSSYNDGYDLAVKAFAGYGKKKPRPRKSRWAKQRAEEVRLLVRKSTKKMLKHDKKSVRNYATSPERAQRIAEYEAGLAYFQGVQDAIGGFKELGKEWQTFDSDACEKCQDCEEEGQIPMNEEFANGYNLPPGHISCRCKLVIRPMEW